MATFHDSELKGNKTQFEGVSWHGATTEGIINETKTPLPGKEDLMLESEIIQNKSIFSFIRELFSKQKEITETERLTPSLPESEVPIIEDMLPEQNIIEATEVTLQEIKSEAPTVKNIPSEQSITEAPEALQQETSPVEKATVRDKIINSDQIQR
ncbi:hypothetical protein NF27_CG00360 [Candidatus Jidaibacter acanthamoeba]|uniref:Uncharacterized protein n=1 Tax=Candidatus Jidaibacter acanthamoebae TaxID=86105 RepID=A0A0C1N0L8_9RICK|nr:hypothetical protein [Candidatus Jidaibacter acanthamoeba]KIE05856.1 hypothetical protein NF27_CG00360 [Candidatus Jidaibacter acanthamoeba]